ncbi:MAG: histidine phosphatase family protein [Bryobacterales bacterium]|nr:histidine phosphatase family protein [Bryobacterales bacterium]
MSSLVLVRHGQARAFEKHSDRLSELGEQQARVLGEWWRARGVTFGAAICGTLERQRRTAELAGLDGVIEDSRWNEYDAGGVVARGVPALAAADPEFARLHRAAEEHRYTPEANRHFQRMFEILMNRWVEGTLRLDDVEPWDVFQQRVREALRDLMKSHGSGARVAVFTSGGPIAVAVQTVLAAPANKIIEINWRVRNCSITEFLFTRDRISLDLFNAVSHLEPSAVTYR